MADTLLLIDPDPRAWPAGTARQHLQFLAEMYRDLPADTRITVPLEVVRDLATEPSRPGGPKETASTLEEGPQDPTAVGDTTIEQLRGQVAVIERYADATYTKARRLRAHDQPVAAAELETAAFGLVSAADSLRPHAGLPEPTYRGPVLVPAHLLLYAFRYALGRRTNAPGDVAAALVEHKLHLQPEWRAQIVRDVQKAVAARKAGHDVDVTTWCRVAAVMAAGAGDG